MAEDLPNRPARFETRGMGAARRRAERRAAERGEDFVWYDNREHRLERAAFYRAQAKREPAAEQQQHSRAIQEMQNQLLQQQQQMQAERASELNMKVDVLMNRVAQQDMHAELREKMRSMQDEVRDASWQKTQEDIDRKFACLSQQTQQTTRAIFDAVAHSSSSREQQSAAPGSSSSSSQQHLPASSSHQQPPAPASSSHKQPPAPARGKRSGKSSGKSSCKSSDKSSGKEDHRETKRHRSRWQLQLQDAELRWYQAAAADEELAEEELPQGDRGLQGKTEPGGQSACI